MNDPYATLSVPRDSSPEVVRAAYRRLLLQLHPDKAGSHRHVERMCEVQAAYAILSDPERRKTYDSLNPVFRRNVLKHILAVAKRIASLRSMIVEETIVPDEMFCTETATDTTTDHPRWLDVHTRLSVPVTEIYRNNGRRIEITGEDGSKRDYVVPLLQPRVVIKGGGARDADTGQAGDAIIHVDCIPDRQGFFRGPDGVLELDGGHVTIYELFFGVQRRFPHLDGTPIDIDCKLPLKTGSFDGHALVLKLPGRGLPLEVGGSSRGDLRVSLRLVRPAGFEQVLKRIR